MRALRPDRPVGRRGGVACVFRTLSQGGRRQSEVLRAGRRQRGAGSADGGQQTGTRAAEGVQAADGHGRTQERVDGQVQPASRPAAVFVEPHRRHPGTERGRRRRRLRGAEVRGDAAAGEKRPVRRTRVARGIHAGRTPSRLAVPDM